MSESRHVEDRPPVGEEPATPAPLPPLPVVREIAPGQWRTFASGRLLGATEAEIGLQQHLTRVTDERDRLLGEKKQIRSALRRLASATNTLMDSIENENEAPVVQQEAVWDALEALKELPTDALNNPHLGERSDG